MAAAVPVPAAAIAVVVEAAVAAVAVVVVVPDDKIYFMHNKIPYYWLLILFFAGGLFPLLYVNLVTAQWNPFAMNGQHFIRFYLLCTGGSYFVLLLVGYIHRPVVFPVFIQWLLAGIWVSGLVRLGQGMYHAKPVGYLVLLLLGQFLCWKLGKAFLTKKETD